MAILFQTALTRISHSQSLGKAKTRILWRGRAGLPNTLFFAEVRQVEGIRRFRLVVAEPVRNAG